MLRNAAPPGPPPETGTRANDIAVVWVGIGDGGGSRAAECYGAGAPAHASRNTEPYPERDGLDTDVANYISNNYTMLPSRCGSAHVSVKSSPGSPSRSPKSPKSPLRSPGRAKGVRSNLPVIAESSVMSTEGDVQAKTWTTPHASPDMEIVYPPEPPNMSSSLPDASVQGSPKSKRGEVAELVVRLREERRGNMLLAERIRSLENVVREQETLLREADSRTPKTPFEWGQAALRALDQASGPLSLQEPMQTCDSGMLKESAAVARVQAAGGASLVRTRRYTECGSQTAESDDQEAGMQGGGFVSGESQAVLKAQLLAASEREQTQTAKISALLYKVSSMSQEMELLHLAFDERERKRTLELKDATDQVKTQDNLVTTLRESLEQQEAKFTDLVLCTESAKAEHREQMEYLRAAMEDTKELLTKQLQNERETSQTIIQALNMEAESLRAQLICQEAPGRKDFVNTCDVGVGDDEVSPMLLPVDKDARETVDLRCVSDPHRTARRICHGPVHTNFCAPSLVPSLSPSSRLDLDIMDKADQALERLLDSLETNASGNTPDSALSDGDTLHGTMRNNPVEFSGDSEEEGEGANLAEGERLSKEAARTKAKEEEAARAKVESAKKKAADPQPVIVRKQTEKATCRAPAVAGNAMMGDKESTMTPAASKAGVIAHLQPLLQPRLHVDDLTLDEAAPLLAKMEIDFLRTTLTTGNVQPVLTKLKAAAYQEPEMRKLGSSSAGENQLQSLLRAGEEFAAHMHHSALPMPGTPEKEYLCNLAGDSRKVTRKARLPGKTCAEEAAQRRKEGVGDEEGETIDVELYNKAREELMLARKTAEDNATEIENLKLQLEHMKGFLTNLTVIG